MSRTRIITALGLAIALQFFVLSGMLVAAAMPLWTGTEVRVKTVPIDPRSMFRGNYARLNYEISQLPNGQPASATDLRVGEIVYVSLQPAPGGLYEFAEASLTKPAEGVFLRGRVTSRQSPYRLKYGIEAFFAPKDKALQLEKDLRDGGVAVLMVATSGKAALADVVPNTAED